MLSSFLIFSAFLVLHLFLCWSLIIFKIKSGCVMHTQYRFLQMCSVHIFLKSFLFLNLWLTLILYKHLKTFRNIRHFQTSRSLTSFSTYFSALIVLISLVSKSFILSERSFAVALRWATYSLMVLSRFVSYTFISFVIFISTWIDHLEWK